MQVKAAPRARGRAVEANGTPDDAVYLRAAALFFALGDPARLRLLDALAAGERCVSDVAAALGDDVQAISQRLRLLRFYGLVERRREGKHVYYTLADAHVAELVRGGLQHAAEGPARAR